MAGIQVPLQIVPSRECALTFEADERHLFEVLRTGGSPMSNVLGTNRTFA